MKRLTTVLFYKESWMRRFIAALFAFALMAAPAMATPPVFNGNVVTQGLPTFNVVAYGAKGDGVTDDTAAVNAAITAASNAGGGTVYLPRPSVKYLILGALTVPYTGTQPVQKPVRLTGDGSTWNGYWANSPVNGGTVLDMQYTGGDGLHPAKIDTRGAGVLEIDHLTIEDTSNDNFLFVQTTNTTVYIHDNAFIGNPANSTTACTQDAIRLGGKGYSTTGSISSGSSTLTINSSLFTASMVGWNISIGGVGNRTIATYISPTQVTLSASSGATVSGASVNFWGGKTADIQAPFQGYGSVIARNYYSHIQRGVIWGIYANNITVEDETYSNTDGSSLAQGAPYYFESNSDVQDGNVIRGGTVEVTGYPYLVSMQGFQRGNTFIGIGAYDHNGTTIGVYYLNGNALNNTIIEGQVDSVLNPVLLAGSGANMNTVISSGIGNVPSNFVYAVNAVGTVGRGHAFQIDGHDVVYSDNGGTDVNLNLAAPGNSGVVNFLTGSGSAAVANAHQLQIDGTTSLYGSGTGIYLASQGVGGTIHLVDTAASPAPVTASSIQVTSFSTTGTTNTLNGWQFNPNASTDFYWGSSGTTAAKIHFRTNGYSNGDTAVITSGGAWQGGHNACASNSGLPCSTTVTCSISAGTTCTANATVPSTGVCTATLNSSDTTTGAQPPRMGALSTNTQPVIFTVGSSQTSTAAANVSCV